MKKWILIFCLLLYAAPVLKAQTLQFSRVMILNNSVSYTVPAGKVWKVESAVYNSYQIGYSQTSRVVIDGATTELIPFVFYDGNAYARAPISTSFPMWLPAGTTIQPIEKVSKMFAIEFTVVTP